MLRRTPYRLALLALLLAGSPNPPCASAQISDQPRDRLPSRHWSYAELEELWTAGELDRIWIYDRPLSRVDVASALLRAPAGAAADPRFSRLRREFGLEISELDSLRSVAYTPPAVRGRDGRTEYRASIRGSAGESRGAGHPWKSDSLTELALSGDLLYRPGLWLHSDVLIRNFPGSRHYADPLVTGTDITALADQAYLGLSLGRLDGALGRDRLRWGPGQTGSLILGDAAPSMSLMQYSMHWPKLRATAFTSELDSYRGEYLSGHRVDWRPSPGLLLGASEVARYRAGQPEALYLLGVVPYTLVQRMLAADGAGDSGLDVRNNIMMALDVAWRARPGLRLAATLLVDDLPGGPDRPPGRTGYQAGILWTRPRSNRPWTVRAEYTRIRNYVYSVPYHEDYVHQGVPLAYPLGPDLADAWLRVDLDPTRDVRLWLDGGVLRKGAGHIGDFLDTDHDWRAQPSPAEFEGTVEQTESVDLGARYFVRDNLQASASLGGRSIRNYLNVAGQKLDQLVGEFSIQWRW